MQLVGYISKNATNTFVQYISVMCAEYFYGKFIQFGFRVFLYTFFVYESLITVYFLDIILTGIRTRIRHIYRIHENKI